MTCKNNKKGCNNKFLISTWMLVSMVCMLSVSDMFGMKTPVGSPLDPYTTMKAIEENPDNWEAFNKIFDGHEGLMKRNCCCGGINIAKTRLPKSKEDESKSDILLGTYIRERFILTQDNEILVNDEFDEETNAKCEAFDNIILGV